MGVTFIAPQGTYTAPAKLVSKSITENGTYDPADDNANGYSSVTVEVEGGGGGGDFSTAVVTVTYTGNDVLTLYIPIYYEVPDLGIVMQGWTNFDEEEPTQTLAIDIPTEGFLIVGGNVPQFTSSNTQVTGNAEVTDGMIKISGDCTITIS